MDRDDLLMIYPDFPTIVQDPLVREELLKHRVEQIRLKAKGKVRTQELRVYTDEAKRKAIAGLVTLMDSNDESIQYKACSRLAGSVFAYQNKKAEREAEIEFEQERPKDDDYPQVTD